MMKVVSCSLLAAVLALVSSATAFAVDLPLSTVPSFVADLTTDYLNGKWDAVDASLTAHAQEIAALPAKSKEKADVAIIATAFAECRPAWWKLTKAGEKVDIHPTVWNRKIDATWLPKGDAVTFHDEDGRIHFDLSWPAADMDSTAQAEHGFTKGELGELTVWMTLGSADTYGLIPLSSWQNLTKDNQNLLARYVDMRECVTGAYYGSPRARRWAVFLYLNTWQPKYKVMLTQISREAVGALLLQQLVADPAKYPSIKLPSGDGEITEAKCAAAVAGWVVRHPWTLAEDQSLREVLKQFATTNNPASWRSGTVVLPNKLVVSLDPDKDKPLAVKRDGWIKSQIQKSLPGQ